MAEAVPLLWIPPSAMAALQAYAAQAYPRECCGLLVGYPEMSGAGGMIISRIVPTANRATQPHRAFEVDPAAHIALLRALREQAKEGRQPAEQVIGHYHSHPDAPAVPSAQDRAQATDPDAVWLIVAASAAGAAEIGAWQATSEADGMVGFRSMNLIFL